MTATTKVRPRDPEVAAISAILRTLYRLPDVEARERVMDFIAARARRKQTTIPWPVGQEQDSRVPVVTRGET